MASTISFVGQASAAAASVTLPAVQAGDLIIIFAHRSVATAPSLATGFTNVGTVSANGNSMRVGYMWAVGTGDVSGTWTNATNIQTSVYRGVASIGASQVQSNATSTAPTVPALTLQNTTGSSWVIGFAASNQTTSLSVPAGTTIRGTSQASVSDTTVAFDTNAGVTSWASTTASSGVTAVSDSIAIELLDNSQLAFVGTYFAQSSLGITGVGTFSPSVNVPAGKTAILMFGGVNPGQAFLTITDTQNNSWSVDSYNPNFEFTAIASAYMTSTLSTTDVVTVSWFNTAAAMRAQMGVFANIAPYARLDQTAINTGTGGPTTFDGGTTATTSQANEVIVSMINLNAAQTMTPSAGYIAFQPATSLRTGGIYQIVSSTGAYNPTATGTSANYSAATATYQKTSAQKATAGSFFPLV